MTDTSCEVIYGEDAPIWSQNLWKNDYVKVVDTEEEARKVVEDYKKTIIYDPR